MYGNVQESFGGVIGHLVDKLFTAWLDFSARRIDFILPYTFLDLFYEPRASSCENS